MLANDQHSTPKCFTGHFKSSKCILNGYDRNVFPWNATLGQILHKLKLPSNGDFLVKFTSESSLSEKLKLCLYNQEIQTRTTEYLKHCLGALKQTCKCWAGQKKTVSTAKDYLIMGNVEFENGRLLNAWVNYSRALVFAPEACEEAPLAYSNRAAVYFRLEQFENSIDDIETALSLGFAKYWPVVKLLLSKVECLLALGRIPEAQNLLVCEAILKDLQSQDEHYWSQLVEKSEEIVEVIVKVHINSNHLKNFKRAIQEHVKEGLFTPIKKFCSLSSKIDMRNDLVKGRQLCATEEISPGEIVAISQPFTAVMSLSCAVHLDRCANCMAACFPQTYWQHSEEFVTYPLMSSPSVCSHCCNVIYCSKACRDKAWKTYHQFECGQLDILHKLTFSPYNLHLALRALYSTGSLAVNQLVAKACAEMKDPLQLEDPVNYGHIYRMAFNESETGFADQCTFQLTQCILACLLTKLAEQSKFVQAPTDRLFTATTLLRHLLQYMASKCSYTKQRIPSFNEVDKGERCARKYPSICFFSQLDPIVALLSHSCSPNLTVEAITPFDYFYLQSNLMQCQTRRTIMKEEELTISYIDIISKELSVQLRQKLIFDAFGFLCACKRCVENNPNEFGRYHAIKCDQCKGVMQREEYSPNFCCSKCPLRKSLQKMKQIYAHVAFLELQMSNMETLFLCGKAEQDSAKCQHAIRNMDTLVCRELVFILHQNSLALAEHCQTLRRLCVDIGWNVCYNSTGYNGNGKKFRHFWAISEISTTIIVSLYGWESVQVHNELVTVVDSFAKTMIHSNFVHDVLLGDNAIHKKMQLYLRRLNELALQDD